MLFFRIHHEMLLTRLVLPDLHPCHHLHLHLHLQTGWERNGLARKVNSDISNELCFVCLSLAESFNSWFIHFMIFVYNWYAWVCANTVFQAKSRMKSVALNIIHILLIFTVRGWLDRFFLCMAVFLVTVVIKMNFNYKILIPFPLCMSFCIIVNCNIARDKLLVIFVIFKYTLSSSQFCHKCGVTVWS